jgi:hypothetical protein
MDAASILRTTMRKLNDLLLVPEAKDYPVMGGIDEAILAQRARMIALEDLQGEYAELARHVKANTFGEGVYEAYFKREVCPDCKDEVTCINCGRVHRRADRELTDIQLAVTNQQQSICEILNRLNQRRNSAPKSPDLDPGC